MPVDRPPRAPAARISSQITQTILNWIEQNVQYGITHLANLYLETEVHPGHREALSELEGRYGLEAGELVTPYVSRLLVIGKGRARTSRIARMVPVESLGVDQLVRQLQPSDEAHIFLECLPEPELVTALELGGRSLADQRGEHPDLFGYLERVFRARGLPYTASATDGIQWVGERAVRKHAIEPALAALADPRLANASEEFDKARGHLRRGELKDAGKWAGDAVETTMAILLGAHGHPQPQTKHGTDLVQAKHLFDQLQSTAVGLLTEDRDKELIYAPMKVRNACGHGAGANPRPPDRAYVEAGVAAAAVAIAYLASKLP
jgi:hypothetical protein